MAALWPTILGVVLLGLIGAGARSRTTRATPADDFWNWVSMEVERARRHEAPVALIRFVPGKQHRVDDVLAANPRDHLRPTDHWQCEGDSIYILAPETDDAGAQGLVRRVVPADVRAAGTVHVASFPEDSFTERGLIARLQGEPTQERATWMPRQLQDAP